MFTSMVFSMCGCGVHCTLTHERTYCEIQVPCANENKFSGAHENKHTQTHATCRVPPYTHHYGNAQFYLLELIYVHFIFFLSGRVFGVGVGLRCESFYYHLWCTHTHRISSLNDENAMRSKSSIGRTFTLLSPALESRLHTHACWHGVGSVGYYKISNQVRRK